MTLAQTLERLPEPFRHEPFHRLRRGIYDAPEIEVYINGKEDFAFLHPIPATDYVSYRPRVQKLALHAYKKALAVIERRYEKLADAIASAPALLEVGAGDGSFLAYARRRHPKLSIACVEVDENTRAAREAVDGLVAYASLEEAARAGDRFPLVGFFHVLEHVLDPHPFLASCRACLAPGGRLAIEVPSLDDPLLRLYECEAYARFYFQRQHPFVYSAASLRRLLEAVGLQVERCLPHQRYGLENHLHWLQSGEPGGSAVLRDLLAECDDSYRQCLERGGHTDAVVVLVREAS